jgi:leucyl aminopeptidase
MLKINLVKPTDFKGGLHVRFETAPVIPNLEYPDLEAWNISHDTAQKTATVYIRTSQGVTIERVRRAGSLLAKWMAHNKLPSAGIDLAGNDLASQEAAFALVEGLLLGDYRFEPYLAKKVASQLEINLLTENPSAYEETLRRATITCEAANLARDWTNEPANVINPVTLAERVQKLAAEHGLECTVLDDKQLKEMGAGAIVAVGQGSNTPSRLIILKHAGTKKEKPVALVGKSLTYDTGGYSLKSSEYMLGMHVDKAGAMTVVATLVAAARLKLKTPIVGVLAAAENMVSAYAYRPNDIIRTLSGKTVEIINTDAEGRLVLADALTYTQQQFEPRVIVDLATLTGGVVTALGSIRAGMFVTDQGLSDALFQSGERTYERLWPLPLDIEYADLVLGDKADLINSAMPGKKALPIVGAIFLKQFINEGQPWAHLDIAGTAATEKRKFYCVKGATGFGVRLLLDYLNTLE